MAGTKAILFRDSLFLKCFFFMWKKGDRLLFSLIKIGESKKLGNLLTKKSSLSPFYKVWRAAIFLKASKE